MSTALNHRDKMRAGLEMIDFQKNNKLGDDIEAAVSALKKAYAKDGKIEDFSPLNDAIRKHTNISLSFEGIHAVNAAIVPDAITKSNPLLKRVPDFASDAWMEGSRKIITKDKLLEGTVDLKNAKVNGKLFSELTLSAYIGLPLLSQKSEFTVKEVTAIILHELGHAFTFYELATRTVTTNYVLETVSNELVKESSKTEKIKVFNSLKTAGYDLEDIDELAKAETKEAASLLVINSAVSSSRSSIGENIYDLRGSEVIADQFAVRFGYGKDLATGLGKLYKHTPYGNKVYFIALVTLELLWFFNPAALITFMIFSIFYSGGEYDKPRKRMEVILRQMAVEIRKSGLPNSEIRGILENIDAVEKEMEQILANDTLASKLIELMPWNWSKVSARKVQEELEQIGNNRLHELSKRIVLA